MPIATVPLLNTARQSAVVRLSGVDCRLTVWRQPSDGRWHASLEVPTGTPLLSGRRLTADTDLLAGVLHSLPGRLICRPLQGARTEPGAEPWGDTHALVWETDG